MKIDEMVDFYPSEDSTVRTTNQHTTHFGRRKISDDFEGETDELIKGVFRYHNAGKLSLEGFDHIKSPNDIDLKRLTKNHFGITDKKTKKIIGYTVDTGRRYELRSNHIKWDM